LIVRPPLPVPAYILAGGKSRRFGTDKARAILEGQPLIGRLANQLTPVVASITVIADVPDKYADLNLKTLADEQPQQGPLGGLITALADLSGRSSGDWLLLLSCDMVLLRPEWIEQLAAQAHLPAQAVAFRNQRWEPMPALYHTALLPTARVQLAADRRAMQDLLDQAPTAALHLPTDWPTISQINTPTDLQQAAGA
jgi:molybdopterin-guanine dinucleotide biosynthesis protein A